MFGNNVTICMISIILATEQDILLDEMENIVPVHTIGSHWTARRKVTMPRGKY